MALPLSDIVRIVVNLSPTARPRRGFNVALFVGTSDVIPATDRVKLYSSLDSMVEDGFTADMPEYKAASLYFMQSPRPQRVAIGRHVVSEGLTELSVTNIAGATSGAFNLTVNPPEPAPDNKFLYQVSATSIATPTFGEILDDEWLPLTAETDAAPGEFTITGTAGDFVMVAVVNAVTNAVQSVGMAVLGGASVPLGLPPAETAVDAIRACRSRTSVWYTVTYLGATVDEILAISAYVESAQPFSAHFYTTNEALALAGNPNSVFNQLRQKNYLRTLGMYSVTPDAVAGIVGYAMGANTRLSRSAFTLMHKTVVGIVPDAISETQHNFLMAQNGNCYVSRSEGDSDDGANYFMFEDGSMANDAWFDEVLNLDMLVNDMQLAILDLFKARPKVAQTEEGMNDIKLAMMPSLRRMVVIGFIAPGQWNGPSIWITEDYAPLQTGDRLERGWEIFSEPVDEQSQADRDARIAPPIYVPIKLAGAIHSVLVRIDVNR